MQRFCDDQSSRDPERLLLAFASPAAVDQQPGKSLVSQKSYGTIKTKLGKPPPPRGAQFSCSLRWKSPRPSPGPRRGGLLGGLQYDKIITEGGNQEGGGASTMGQLTNASVMVIMKVMQTCSMGVSLLYILYT